MKQIKVFIVDDSSIIRAFLRHIISQDKNFLVIGEAADPYEARDKIVRLRPDLMTLDIEMPRMDGITFLSKIMTSFPIRTVIFSSLSKKNSVMALKALDYGAIDVIEKPNIDLSKGVGEFKDVFLQRLRSASQANLRKLKVGVKRLTVEVVKHDAVCKPVKHVVAIASSTGGTVALKELLSDLPANIPPIVIVQHLPAGFTNTFAASLDKICPFRVKEAEEGDRLEDNLVFVAPGDYHMEIYKSGAFYYVKLHKEPKLHGVRPAADYLLDTVAKYCKESATGIVLTGMGKDGAAGLKKMKEAGSFNIAQDEKTSVVFGMPAEAIDIGAIDVVNSLGDIGQTLMAHLKKQRAA